MNDELLTYFRNMMVALEAVVGLSGGKKIAGMLDVLSASMPPDAAEGWDAVFTIFGEKSPAVLRFDILEGILIALMKISNSDQWLRQWMSSIICAGIHPISLPLCAITSRPKFRKKIFQAYSTFSLDRRNYPVIVDGYPIGDDIHLNPIYIRLPSEARTDNVLSLVPLRVHEQEHGSIRQAGLGWCAINLAFVDMPELRELGPDLVLSGDLDLVSAPNVRSIGPRSRIGGITKVYANNASGWTTNKKALPKGEWEPCVGFRAGNCDVAMSRKGKKRVACGQLSNPVEFPPSFFRIYIALV